MAQSLGSKLSIIQSCTCVRRPANNTHRRRKDKFTQGENVLIKVVFCFSNNSALFYRFVVFSLAVSRNSTPQLRYKTVELSSNAALAGRRRQLRRRHYREVGSTRRRCGALSFCPNLKQFNTWIHGQPATAVAGCCCYGGCCVVILRRQDNVVVVVIKAKTSPSQPPPPLSAPWQCDIILERRLTLGMQWASVLTCFWL